MNIEILSSISPKTDFLFVPIFKENFKTFQKNIPQNIKTFIKKIVGKKEFFGKRGEKIATYLNDELIDKLAIIGFGSEKKYSKVRARELGAVLGKYVKTLNIDKVDILVNDKILKFAEEFMEGLLMSQYKIDKLKTITPRTAKKDLDSITIITEKSTQSLKDAFKKAEIICESEHFVKDLVNSPSNIIDGEKLEQEAKRISKANGYKLTVLREKELKKMGWGGLLAVNQGAEKEAKCIILEHYGAKNEEEKPIVIVGKAIIFDSGGYNIKPTHSIETMHQDMAGGAVVLGIFDSLKELGVKKNIIGIIPIAENMISANAYRPSDIIKMLSGLTVEITNTDSEGRVIVADGLYYGTKYKPEYLISIATLTLAVYIALGPRYAGLIGNNVNLRKKIKKAGDQVDEKGWPLPLNKDYIRKMKSEIADVRNADGITARVAGAIKGAAFLSYFVEDYKWCHIDIGGTAFIEDDVKEFQTKGATAYGLRMLLKFLENEQK